MSRPLLGHFYRSRIPDICPVCNRCATKFRADTVIRYACGSVFKAGGEYGPDFFKQTAKCWGSPEAYERHLIRRVRNQ